MIESMYGDREEAQEGKFSRWPAASELLQLTTSGTSPKYLSPLYASSIFQNIHSILSCLGFGDGCGSGVCSPLLNFDGGVSPPPPLLNFTEDDGPDGK